MLVREQVARRVGPLDTGGAGGLGAWRGGWVRGGCGRERGGSLAWIGEGYAWYSGRKEG